MRIDWENLKQIIEQKFIIDETAQNFKSIRAKPIRGPASICTQLKISYSVL